MKTLKNSMNNKFCNHYIAGQCTYEIDPANSAFPTVKEYREDAGSNAMPGSGLGVTHGTDSDMVSNLVNLEIKF